MKCKYFTMTLLGVFLLVSFPNLRAQFEFVYDDSILVVKNNDTISMAWSGGMSHPQFSTIDVDFDGKEELIAFEPENGLISVYEKSKINGEIVYKYLHHKSKLFPADLRYRMKLIDFDGDGKKDIFTYAIGGIKVYKNTGNTNSGLTWDLYADPIMSVVNNSFVNLYSASNEIPAFVDVDGDGDIDVLTFHSYVSRVEWHKNLSMETYGHSDSLIFQLEQACWGDFMEDASGNSIELNSTFHPCGSSLQTTEEGGPRHSGGSILALDLNGSGMQDLIIGDVSYNNLTMLMNGGTNPNDNALMVSFDANYPSSDVPVNLSNFLTAYYEDVDNDGIKDLIVSTTAKGASENTKGVWLYKNNGVNDNPNFEFVEEDFLQNQMIDNGKGAIPVIVDVNNDGLKDLLVANHFNFDGSQGNYSRINYYQNIGTLQKPVFKLINENWENFQNSGFPGRVSPAFADLDGDSDKDMIVGLSNGKLFFYENTGGNGAMVFNSPQSQLKDNNGDFITVPNYATPELFDLDNDGLTDLIIGQGNGPLLYYQNIGTATNYSFKLSNPDLGMVDLSSPSYQQTIGVPRFVRDNGETFLFTGSRSGNVSLYSRIDGRLTPGLDFELISDEYAGINTKGFSAPFIVEFRGDNSYDFFVGNEIGGIWSYRAGDTSSLGVTNESLSTPIDLNIYPNPSKSLFAIELSNLKGQAYDYRVLDPLGRTINSGHHITKSQIDIQILYPESGMYFIEVVIPESNYRIVRKLLIE
ncbi:FG-GAP-like repeat-containing protein [Brumimicrobium oceani]|nr:FG-GAP-like repeat-containing protein [Brumimicrobium oceani]